MVKNNILTTRTSDDLYHRFRKVCEKRGWKGDDWIIMFLGQFENENDYLRSQIAIERKKIWEYNKKIKDLENKKIGSENLIEELNEQCVDDHSTDVDNAVDIILQKFHKQNTYNIRDFLEENIKLVEFQAYRVGVSTDDLYMMCFEKS